MKYYCHNGGCKFDCSVEITEIDPEGMQIGPPLSCLQWEMGYPQTVSSPAWRTHPYRTSSDIDWDTVFKNISTASKEYAWDTVKEHPKIKELIDSGVVSIDRIKRVFDYEWNRNKTEVSDD